MTPKPKSKAGKNKEQSGRRPAALLGLDFATSGVKAVHFKRIKDRITLVAADILPPSGPDETMKPVYSKTMAAYYAALCATMEDVTIRVFSEIIPDDENVEALVRGKLNASNDYRVGTQVLSRGRNKRESSILGVSVPEKTIQHYLSLFANGAPAPHSLEVSGLAAFSAFLFSRGRQTENQTVCLIESGARCTYAAFMHNNQFQLINRFECGGELLQRHVQQMLGVDREMACEILSGGSVDLTAPVRQAMGPFLKQLSIYREFVERQCKSSVSAVYLSGGLSASPYWKSAVRDVLSFAPEEWSPFEKIDILPNAFPEHLKGQESRFAAAAGAALAGMEES
ncbi:MAG: hypothetical protein MUC65_00190 [Pontiellaceae bacterium]|jgi:Tfp pilus assembly PilM family ATPase|nr:hypothetical protein [Pontiellaceae bacterium]